MKKTSIKMKGYLVVIKRTLIVLCGVFLAQSCIEAFEIETTEFKSALVIEGTITDREETQRILVSRTFPLDTVLMAGVINAKVSILVSNGDVHGFSQTALGEYESDSPFAAVSGLSYTLRVQTEDGNTYTSEEEQVPAKTTIENVYAVRDFKDNGAEEGIFIYVDSYDPTGESKFYRYEYEETYKIVAPFWSPTDAYVVAPLPNPEVGIRARTQEERVCYKTVASNTIIQENTTEFGEDRINKLPVRFINRENFILSHRYSILVKQYVQTRAAFLYYETLEALSGSESLFSQIQAGFLEGNIKSETNPEEDVVGFFQISTVSEDRIFFNYTDYFLGERLPDYVSDCPLLAPPLTSGGPPPTSPLIDGIERNLLKYYSEYVPQDDILTVESPGPYLMVYAVCGDCTVLGSNIVPDFWQE